MLLSWAKSENKTKFIPAPFDEKNMTTDWIVDIFDEELGLFSGNKCIGFIRGCTTIAKWEKNQLIWRIVDGCANDAIFVLENRLKVYEGTNDLTWVESHRSGNAYFQYFYFMVK